MELPSAEAARRAACLPDELVGVGLVFKRIECGLHGAVDVVTEFSGFVLVVSFDGHVASMVLPVLGLIKHSRKKEKFVKKGKADATQ